MRIEDAIRQPRFTNEYQKLSINLMYTAHWLEGIARQAVRPFGITMPQYNILRILRGQKGNPLSVNSLIERMIDPSSNASRLVDKLEEKGLVVRRSCPNDRRAVDVTITEKGLSLIDEMEPAISELHRAVGTLSETDARQINEWLDTLRVQYMQTLQTS